MGWFERVTSHEVSAATEPGRNGGVGSGQDNRAVAPKAEAASTAGKKRRGRPPRIRREDVVDAAAAIGLTDLTFKAVADALGVGTTAIYYYVNDREELLDLVAEELSRRTATPAPGNADWFEWARDTALHLREMLRAAPGLAERALANMHTTPGILERYETSLQLAVESGFDERSAYWATRAVFEFVQGWVLREERRAQAWGTAAAYRKKLLSAAASSEPPLPILRRVVRNGSRRSEEARFEFTLDCLLEGLKHSTQDER